MTVYISVELQRRVRERFANICAYCRTAEDLTATTFEFEHIVPLSAGGATAFENLCLSCPMCNRYKSDRVLLQTRWRNWKFLYSTHICIDGPTIFPGTTSSPKS